MGCRRESAEAIVALLLEDPGTSRLFATLPDPTELVHVIDQTRCPTCRAVVQPGRKFCHRDCYDRFVKRARKKRI